MSLHSSISCLPFCIAIVFRASLPVHPLYGTALCRGQSLLHRSLLILPIPRKTIFSLPPPQFSLRHKRSSTQSTELQQQHIVQHHIHQHNSPRPLPPGEHHQPNILQQILYSRHSINPKRMAFTHIRREDGIHQCGTVLDGSTEQNKLT